MKWITRFGQFWYDFVVGDDWTIAVVVIVAVALTSFLAHRGWNAWLVLPVFVVGALGTSSWRALREQRRLHGADGASDATGGVQ